MNVLSLFDGMSCGQIALERAGIKVDNYFASEIDKHAIQVTMQNYPNTIQLGDVTKWREWDLPKIDLIIGGSPCQGFSFAGNGLNFKDPRSKLYFEFVEILHSVRPKYFLLENVKMKKEWEKVITNHLEVEPVEINSALVSAQNRVRLYWTNIPGLAQPEDKNIFIKDVLDDGFAVAAMRGRYLENGVRKDYGGKTKQYIEFRHDGKSNCLTTVAKDNVVVPNILDKRVLAETFSYRYLKPIECERLQTVPERYTSCVSVTQRCKMLGNGWTVDVIAHILSGIK